MAQNNTLISSSGIGIMLFNFSHATDRTSTPEMKNYESFTHYITIHLYTLTNALTLLLCFSWL